MKIGLMSIQNEENIMTTLTQKNCQHIYDDYASESVGKNKVKIWRRCRICNREFTYIRKIPKGTTRTSYGAWQSIS